MEPGFAELFFYGDAVEKEDRSSPKALSDRAWARSLLLRADHPRWRLHLEFLSVLFSVMHRRELISAIRIKMKSQDMQARIRSLKDVTSADFAHAAAVMGEKGNVQEALKSDKLKTQLKDLLRAMQLVQMNVPCTDGSRVRMQHHMRSLQVWSGFYALFVTLNPADVKHPLTVHYLGDPAYRRARME